MVKKNSFLCWIKFFIFFSPLIFWFQEGISQSRFDEDLFEVFQYRQLGPYRAGAWISDIDVPENPGEKYKYTFYIAARNGGVWKTTNNGTTFFPIFDSYGVNSIGVIRVDLNNPEIIWVGTGDVSNTRSAYAGNGIFKSMDAGETFQFMGLKDSHHISRIAIHPKNSNIVYVAVMGHLYSTNKERGVFKTTDGGITWKNILFINEKIGFIDLVINHQNPDTVYAAAYEKYRLPWHFEAGGEESRIYKTTDGGKNWKKLTSGLPSGKIGRIGIDLYRKNPEIVYAVIENLNLKPNQKGEENGNQEFNPLKDPFFDKFIGGEVYRSIDNGQNWEKMNTKDANVSSKAAYSFNQIWIDPNNPENLFINNVQMHSSTDGGRTWKDLDWPPKNLFINMFGDVRTFWINPNDSRHMTIGSDGGVYQTFDGGQTTDHLYHIPLGEIYHVEVDNAVPYNIYLGLQDHEAWRGPSNSWKGEISIEDWHLTGLWDGMYTKVDPADNQWLYTTTQFGTHQRVNQITGERQNIMPKSPKGKPFYRFTWATPIEVSRHNGSIIFTGGQMLLRSLDRGSNWEEMSPDLTNNDPVKTKGRGHIMYNTITTISESPHKAGVIWVGTDDGRVHLTRDHGKNWQEFTKELNELGAPEEIYVSRVLASRNNEQTAFVTKSGFRNDLFKPFVFRTHDFGKTWENISHDLPDSPVSAIMDDKDNPELLFIGNDRGIFVSINCGKNWIPMKNNMPPVPILDVLVHPVENDLIVGTFGRGAFVTDISPLKELSENILNQEIYLFDIESKPKLNYSQQASWGNYKLMGDRHLYTPNETNGIVIYFYLRKKLKEEPEIIIYDSEGKNIKTIKCNNQPGIHKVIWDSQNAEIGLYRIVLKAGNISLEKNARVTEPWKWSIGNHNKIQ